MEAAIHSENSSGSPHAVVEKNYKAHHVAGNWGVKSCPHCGGEMLNKELDEKKIAAQQESEKTMWDSFLRAQK